MTIRAVVFDIGGVLAITPDTGMTEKWEARLHLKPGELNEQLMDVWKDGSFGNISEEIVEQSIGEIMGMDQGQVEAFMADLWKEYLVNSMVRLLPTSLACARAIKPPSSATASLVLGAKNRSATTLLRCAISSFILMRRGLPSLIGVFMN
jgi:hypothetical protein